MREVLELELLDGSALASAGAAVCSESSGSTVACNG